ncbi:hypothetical protein K2173_017237 [Erythroxylum novogranatense]|uniref:Sey1/RHD3-like three-helix bundle domain-containing protein n=1 Tax=Erythroxylum novogranatense TaxID=1862640 RepID=A0AAV8U634_9ROSI|nr:hypothetical protein K2173_017237 [Erythroxylum novogranatense]
MDQISASCLQRLSLNKLTGIHRELRTSFNEILRHTLLLSVLPNCLKLLLPLRLEDYARNVVEAKAKEEAGRVLMRMKDRFSMLFSHDSNSMPRAWTGKEDIRAITKTARSASLKLLSVMVAIRLEDEGVNFMKILSSALLHNNNNKSVATHDPLASSTWE